MGLIEARLSLPEALDRGATVVTANARLARRLLADQAQRRHGAGDRAWRRGDALPWEAWLARAHENALAAGALPGDGRNLALSRSQTALLWQQIIEADLRGERGLLQPAAAARQALKTHELCLAWRIDAPALARGYPQEDTAAFLRWWQALKRRLQDNGWLVPGELADDYADCLAQVPGLRPGPLYLAGFLEFTPQQKALLDRLAAAGTAIHQIAPTQPAPSRGRRLRCTDAGAEAVAAARWARGQLEADPRAAIGIVVPDLAGRASLLARRLTEALDPPAARAPGWNPIRPWNMSLGRPLGDEPAVCDALLMLKAATGRLEFKEAGRLLRSPFVGGAQSEGAARVRAEVMLRELGDMQVRTPRLARILKNPPLARHASARCPDLAARLTDTHARLAGAEQFRSPEAWARLFDALLGAMGWPGERALDSHEFQAVGKWHELLREFARLGVVAPRLSLDTALGRLRRLAGEQVFQPRSAPAPVQVLGLLEAVGQEFDALWIMGLDDEAWPQAPRPDPLLPVALQRKLELPHAGAERERAYAQGVMGHLLAAAPDVVASWPARHEDRQLRASPLIAHLPGEKIGFDTETAPGAGDPSLEWLQESHAPALEDGTTLFHGGARLFQNQSACPFRAYAVHRLGADRLDAPVPGLDARRRGTLVHRVLERIWEELGSQDNLKALNADARGQLIGEAVEAEIETARALNPALFAPRFAQVEARRLRRLMDEWLQRETAREPFAVLARESEASADFNGLTVRLRIDRIDALPDGSRVLIDYKTGHAAARDWDAERGGRAPDPQLPVYSTQFGDELQGLLFAQVKSHQCTWHGVTRAPWHDKDVKQAKDWPAQRRAWREMAAQLAQDFLKGRAEVDPLKEACGYCHLAALCRIDELQGGFRRDRGDDANS